MYNFLNLALIMFVLDCLELSQGQSKKVYSYTKPMLIYTDVESSIYNLLITATRLSVEIHISFGLSCLVAVSLTFMSRIAVITF